MRYSDILPIRASMYVLALINTSLAQGGVAYYLHRKAGVSFLSALSSVLFIAMLEIYQLFLFSTLGVIFYTPVGDAQIRDRRDSSRGVHRGVGTARGHHDFLRDGPP